VVGDLLRLHKEVHVVRTEVRTELEGLEQVQHLEHGEALRWRRRLEDRDAAVSAMDRLAPIRALRGEVALGEEAAEFGKLTRHLAFIEPGAPMRGDAA
jgi:hypothetical protein